MARIAGDHLDFACDEDEQRDVGAVLVDQVGARLPLDRESTARQGGDVLGVEDIGEKRIGGNGFTRVHAVLPVPTMSPCTLWVPDPSVALKI
jgi:hypothetical protein